MFSGGVVAGVASSSSGASVPTEKSRLIQDLEFVQMLANVEYIIWLSKSGYLMNELFGNYLQHLQYLEDAAYNHLLIYPLGLAARRLLSDASVRKAISEEPEISRTIIAEQIYCSWANQPEIKP